jgi:hypothetical protein
MFERSQGEPMRHDRVAWFGACLFWSAGFAFVALQILWPSGFLGL